MWLKLGDEVYDDPRIEAAGAAATGVLVRMLAYSARHLSDGLVPVRWAQVVSWGDQGSIDALIAQGLVEQQDGGYYLPTYLESNPTRADYERQRENGRKRAAKSREAKAK